MLLSRIVSSQRFQLKGLAAPLSVYEKTHTGLVSFADKAFYAPWIWQRCEHGG